jgi:hypothetical protein
MAKSLLKQKIQAESMKVAFGKIKITPPKKMGGPIGRALAGYTPIKICSGVYDDIYARGALIETTILGNIKKRTLFLSLDILKTSLLFTEYVKEKIQDEYKIHPNQVMVHGIHTHKSLDISGEFAFKGGYPAIIKGIMIGGYFSDDKYKVWMVREIVKMVGTMINDLQPAKIAWMKKKIAGKVLINRRHPLRHSTSDLGIIVFKSVQTNALIGMMINYGMHPTTLSWMVDKLSADYPGRIHEKIEELSENKVASIFFIGPAGDLNPITTMGKDFEFLDKNREGIYKQTGDIEHTKKIGYALGKKVWDVTNTIPDEKFYDELEIQAFTKTFWVPMDDYHYHQPSPNRISQKLIHFLKKHLLLKIAMIKADIAEPNFPGFALKHKGKEINLYSQVVYFRFKAIKGNDIKRFAISGVPGELFEDIAVDMRERTPEKENTFIYQNANDWISYLFPLKEYPEGGYESMPSFSALAGTFTKFAYFRLLKDVDADITGGFN